jgi:hypothetical protein
MASRPFSWLGNHITSADVPALRSFCISSWRWTVLRLTIYIWGIKGGKDEERAIQKESVHICIEVIRRECVCISVAFRTEAYFSIDL